MTNGVIVTATDTGVGKTVFSAALIAATEAAYWKPIQAGLEGETDLETVARLSRAESDRLHAEAYRLTTACSPHRAAEIDNITIEPQALVIPASATNDKRPIVIEGAGGLLVPLTREHLQIEQFATWGLPIILCTRTTLGTINHTLLSVEAIRQRGLPLKGIAFIGDENADTQRTIAECSRAPILGRLPLVDPLDHTNLREAFTSAFRSKDILTTP